MRRQKLEKLARQRKWKRNERQGRIADWASQVTRELTRLIENIKEDTKWRNMRARTC